MEISSKDIMWFSKHFLISSICTTQLVDCLKNEKNVLIQYCDNFIYMRFYRVSSNIIGLMYNKYINM